MRDMDFLYPKQNIFIIFQANSAKKNYFCRAYQNNI